MTFLRPSDVKVLSQKDRLNELYNILDMPVEKILNILHTFEAAIKKSLEEGKSNETEVEWLKTWTNQLPTGKENGEFYSLCVSREDVHANRVQLEKGQIVVEQSTSVKYMHHEEILTMRSPMFTASSFLAAVIESIKLLNISKDGPCAKFVLSSSVPLLLDSLDSASFHYCFESADSEDPLEKIDLIELLNIGLHKNGINAVLTAFCNQEIALLMAGSFERPSTMPRCLIGIYIGSTLGVSFFQPEADSFGLDHSICGFDVTNFLGTIRQSAEKNYTTNICLPICPVDLEIAACEYSANGSTKLFEQIVTITALTETCRRLLIQALQDQVPDGVWVRNSLSFESAVAILSDISPPEKSLEVLRASWEWKASADHANIFHRLVVSTFSRSAAMAAVIIAAVAKRTKRMQPALGGITCAIGGILGTNKVYQSLLRKHLDSIFCSTSKTTAASIQFLSIVQSRAKGAAILNHKIQNSQI